MEVLTREQIVLALTKLNERLAAVDVRAECHLVGWAVMCLAFDARPSTRDVDAWFSEPQTVRRAALEVARELDLPEDWPNDAAKAFIPERAGFERWASYSHLEVAIADERTLLAMKCAAARTQEDARDIRLLTDRLRIASVEGVLDVVLAYYPPDRLPVRTRLLLEEMFDDRG